MAMRRMKFSTYSEPSGSDDVVILEINDQEFRCQPVLPGIYLMRWISGLDMQDVSSLGTSVEAFLKQAILPEEWERFDDYISDPKNNVDLATLSKMAGELAGTYTGNPTQSSSGSLHGSPKNGPGLRGVPSGTVSTLEPPLPPISSQ